MDLYPDAHTIMGCLLEAMQHGIKAAMKDAEALETATRRRERQDPLPEACELHATSPAAIIQAVADILTVAARRPGSWEAEIAEKLLAQAELAREDAA